MAISFNEIPLNIRVPGVYSEYDSSQAVTGSGVQPFNGILIGLKNEEVSNNDGTPLGTLADDALHVIPSAKHAAEYWGAGSLLHRQAIAWFANNRSTPVYGIATSIDTTAGRASRSLQIEAAQTTISSARLYIAGELILFGGTGPDPATTAVKCAEDLRTKINARPDLPVRAEISPVQTDTVVVRAKFKGAVGDQIDIRETLYVDDVQAPGLTFAATGGPGRLTGGTGDPPAIATTFGKIVDRNYNMWVFPFADSTSKKALDGELKLRSEPTQQNDGMAFFASDMKYTDLVALNATYNSKYLTHICFPGPKSSDAAGTGSPTPAWELSAAYAAQAAQSLSIDPARPLQTLPLVGIKAHATARWSWENNNGLLGKGISPTYVDGGGNVRLWRAVTMYTTSALGVDDTAYLNVNTVFTLAYIRWSVRRRLGLKFPRYKLANDGTRFGRGQAVVTPKIIKSEIVALFGEWENIGIVENADNFVEDLIVERNTSDPDRVDVKMPPDLVNQLRVTAIQIQFIV